MRSTTNAKDYILEGNKLLEEKKFKKAVRHFKHALSFDPQDAVAANNLATAYYQMGKLKKSEEAFRKACKLDPVYTDPLYNLSLLFKEKGLYQLALTVLRKALATDPTHPLANYEAGLILTSIGNLNDALAYFQTSLALRPDFAEAWVGLGKIYNQLKDLALAEDYYLKAILLNPNLAEPHYLLALVLRDSGRMKEAAAYLEKTTAINPLFLDAHGQLYMLKRDVCDWEHLDEAEERLIKSNAEQPLTSIIRTDNPAENLAAARRWCKRAGDQLNNDLVFKSYPRSQSAKTRIGYFSRDFCSHPIGHMTATMFALHDRTNFEVFAFSYGLEPDNAIRRTVKSGCDKFIDIQNLGKLEAAEIIHRNKIDILVDLGGHTAENRLEIFTLRPAPVEVTWLGFPGTSGADFIDYVIVDKIIVPKKQARFYTEKLVSLPRCYQVNNSQSKISKRKFTRTNCSLPPRGFIFASFNYAHKIDPVMWRVWMNILKRVPDGTLWLLAEEADTQYFLNKEAERAGVDPKRLVFALKLGRSAHLARLSLADLGLDTRLYGGHTTTSDALWSGVPVITKIGDHFASRVCASILTEAGLPELITKSLREYEDKAVYLAQHAKELTKIRSKITQEHLKKNLYDTKGFVRDLEKAYLLMWKRYLSGKPPTQLEVT